jgi:hypothetical protein
MELTEFRSKQNHSRIRSNIDDIYKVEVVYAELETMDGICRVNIDLDDCENILRLKCDPEINEHCIRQVVSQLGYDCDELS